MVEKEPIEAIITEAIFEKKGKEVIRIGFNDNSNALCDCFFICHGDSTTQVSAIADSIQDKLKLICKLKARHVEGYTNSQWVLLDYADIVVHIFLKEYRDSYKMEELWGDAEISMIHDNN